MHAYPCQCQLCRSPNLSAAGLGHPQLQGGQKHQRRGQPEAVMYILDVFCLLSELFLLVFIHFCLVFGFWWLTTPSGFAGASRAKNLSAHDRSPGHWDCVSIVQANKQTNKQTHKQTKKQTQRLTRLLHSCRACSVLLPERKGHSFSSKTRSSIPDLKVHGWYIHISIWIILGHPWERCVEPWFHSPQCLLESPELAAAVSLGLGLGR